MSARPKPPTFWNSYTRTLILDTIMKLSGTIGVTQKTMTISYHCGRHRSHGGPLKAPRLEDVITKSEMFHGAFDNSRGPPRFRCRETLKCTKTQFDSFLLAININGLLDIFDGLWFFMTKICFCTSLVSRTASCHLIHSF